MSKKVSNFATADDDAALVRKLAHV